MRFIQQLEKYAHSVLNFPYQDLEVDWKEENDTIVVSLYWTDDTGNTSSKDIASMPFVQFKYWAYSDAAKRLISYKVEALFDPNVEYKDYYRPQKKKKKAPEELVVNYTKGRNKVQVPPYTLVKGGVTLEVEEHHSFCESNDLNKQAILQVVRGTRKTFKGYHLPGEADVEYRERKEYQKRGDKVFKNEETGEEVVVRNVAKFCREYDLPYDTFKKLAQGRSKTSHGWTLL